MGFLAEPHFPPFAASARPRDADELSMGHLGGVGNPAVSIILATNRGGCYLADTLESVTGQTFGDWELIVVDDGSTEPAVITAAVKGVDRARIVRQKNAGVSVARNVGFAHSSGEFIAYLDDDDVWRSDKLERQVEALCRDDAAASCHSGYWFLDGRGERVGTEVRVRPATTDGYLSGEVDLPRINTLLVRRGVVQRVGGFLSGLTLYEDCEFAFRIVREGPVLSLSDPLVGWRRYPDSVSFTRDARTMNDAAIHAIMMTRWGAETRGNHPEVELLSRNIERAKRRLAEHHANEFCHRLRTGPRKGSLSDVEEGVRHGPLVFARRCARLLLGGVTTRLRGPADT
jgi:glycosyltransferase involved in cell wall biosynthesis